MNFADLIEQFVELFGFSEEEKEQISTDLKRVIAAEFLTVVTDQYPSREDVTLLRKTFDKDNVQELGGIITSIFRNQEFSADLKEITRATLQGWLTAVESAFSEEQKRKIPQAQILIEEL